MMRATRNKPNPASNGIAVVFIFILVAAAILLLTGRSDKPTRSPVAHQQDQQAAIQRLANESGNSVYYSEDQGVIRQLSFEWASDSGGNPEQVVNSFLSNYSDIFTIPDPANQLRYQETTKTSLGDSAVIFSQYFNGVPVYASSLVFQVSPQGVLDFYSGGYIPNLSIDTSPRIQENEVLDLIRTDLTNDAILFSEKPQLMIYDPRVFGTEPMTEPRLVWYQQVLSESNYLGFFIDAINGKIFGKSHLLENNNQLKFEIYDAHQYLIPELLKLLIPGLENPDKQKDPTLIFTDLGKTDAFKDKEGEKLPQQIETVYDFFANEYEWYSFDGKDSPIKIYINATYKDSENKDEWITWGNAFFYDGKIFFTDQMVGSIDFLAHEFTHGVTNELVGNIKTENLLSEPKALSESFSDIFAAFIDIEHPWKICRDDCVDNHLILSELLTDMSRNLEDPHENNLPKHYSERVYPGQGKCVKGEANYGCGHINSTIHSHAVFLFTSKIGTQKSSQIIFNALKSRLITPNTDFAHARQAIVLTCKAMTNGYGIDMEDCRQIELAYDQVGIMNPWNVINPNQEQQTPTIDPQLPSMEPESPVQFSDTDTILLVDTSTSMNENDSGGTQKMAAAQKAADNLLEVIASEQQAAAGSLSHQVGLVSFSSSVSIDHSLSADTTTVRGSIDQLSPSGNTAMAAGLQEAFGLLEESGSSNRMIVLLSDGVPTVGLDQDFCLFFCTITEEDVQKYKQEVLEVAGEAKSKNICIHTVGFGDPSADPNSNAYIDEDFLRQVAAASGCGRYYGAQESIQLANAFIELRHSAMGALLLQRSGQISQGETLALGSARVPANQSQLMLTVNWPGSQVIPQLIDPSGKPVNDSYPGAVISQGDTVATILVDRPAAGDWQLSVFGQDVPQGVTSYNALISARAGLNTPQAETSPWLWAGLAAAIVIIGLIAGSSRGAVPASAPYGSGVPRGTQPPADRSSAHLVGTAGGLAGKRVRIGRGGLLGRGPSCQLIIPDPAVSREHARLYFAQNRWFIQDLGSRSGTFINNQRVQNAPLQEGVSIRLGNSTFTFHER